jgi:SecD/SecF fusion protein
VIAFLAMVPIALCGDATVASFGIIVAASSSVFIADPILLFLGDWRKRRRAHAPDPKLRTLEESP